MEFIYNSSNPKADTKWRSEDIAGREEEGCQQLVLLLMQPRHLNCSMRCTQCGGLFWSCTTEGRLAAATWLTASFLTSAGHFLMQGQILGAWACSLFSRMTCQAHVYMVLINHNRRQKYTMVFQTSFSQLVASWDKWRSSSNCTHTIILKREER